MGSSPHRQAEHLSQRGLQAVAAMQDDLNRQYSATGLRVATSDDAKVLPALAVGALVMTSFHGDDSGGGGDGGSSSSD